MAYHMTPSHCVYSSGAGGVGQSGRGFSAEELELTLNAVGPQLD